MEIFKILSVLLCYPEQELVDALPSILGRLKTLEVEWSLLSPLLEHLKEKDLIDLQEEYVSLFDRNPSCSLHLFEHIHGEDRLRGQALVNLMSEYKANGYDISVIDELPDYLPLFLEFLSVCNEDEAKDLLAASIDVIDHIGSKLRESQSVYMGIFTLLVNYSSVQPQPLKVPPVKDMEEAMEKFGPNIEGVEPLLQTNACNLCSVDNENKGASHALSR